jgi:DNA-binding transcriptional MocR family regulator
MDLAAPQASSSGGDAAPPSQPVRDAIAGSPALSPKTNQALVTLVNAAGNDAAKARDNIEQWYNHAMERVASLYKRKTQAIIFGVGAILCVAVNADSIGLVNALSTDKAIRDSLVAEAAANKSTVIFPIRSPYGRTEPVSCSLFDWKMLVERSARPLTRRLR